MWVDEVVGVSVVLLHVVSSSCCQCILLSHHFSNFSHIRLVSFMSILWQAPWVPHAPSVPRVNWITHGPLNTLNSPSVSQVLGASGGAYYLVPVDGCHDADTPWRPQGVQAGWSVGVEAGWNVSYSPRGFPHIMLM